MLKPILDRVLIKIDEKQDKEVGGGIIIPAHVQRDGELKEGIVVNVGHGRILDNGTHLPFTVKAGDKVLFWQSNDLSKVKDEGQEYYIVKEEAIFAIMEQT